MNGVIREFRDFLFRGNIVDLAVAVVIGAAFTAVVNALVADIITPLVAAIFGKPSFGDLSFTINKSEFLYGDFLNQIISFVLTAAVIFFLVIKPMNVLISRRKSGEVTSPTTKVCPECLSEIPIAAHRCAFCTSVVE